MIVIAKDAEKKFLEELQKHKQDLSQIRCLYVELSPVEVQSKKLFNTFLELLDGVPDSYMAEVYICEDKDVFILMHAFMEEAFTEAVKGLLQTFKITLQKGMINYFSIDEHHALLETLCHEKLEKLSGLEKDPAEDIPNINMEELMADLDLNMVETLARRRSDRREALILIVDDDQLARTLVANTIRHKYGTASAATGKEGLNEFLEQAPDVVFLDIGLPDINGHEVLECLFQIDPDAYVIMFSGRKDKDNIMRALRAGAQGFVGKPFTREKLYEYIGKSHFIQKKRLKINPQQYVEA